MKSNFRRGGIFLVPGTALAVMLAIAFNAPIPALVSICIFGFITAIVLILLGDRRLQNSNI